MIAIVAVDQDWGIGKEGQLLCHLSGDLKYFKEKTIGKRILLGRKTLSTFPGGRPLPGRENIILSRNPDFSCPGSVVCHAKEEVLALGQDIIICGGASVYEEFLPQTQCVYVTKIEASLGADRFFTDLDQHPDFYLAWEEENWREEEGLRYRFTKYERIAK